MRLGTADLPSQDGARLLADVPCTVDLRAPLTPALTLAGPRPRLAGLARAVLAQLCALHSPATLEVVLLSADRARGADQRTEEWSWLNWLPHLRPAHGQDCRLLLAFDRDQAEARAGELVRRLESGALGAGWATAADDAVAAAAAAYDGPFTLLVLDGDPGSPALRDALARIAAAGPSAGIHALALTEPGERPVLTHGLTARLAGDVATTLRIDHLPAPSARRTARPDAAQPGTDRRPGADPGAGQRPVRGPGPDRRRRQHRRPAAGRRRARRGPRRRRDRGGRRVRRLGRALRAGARAAAGGRPGRGRRAVAARAAGDRTAAGRAGPRAGHARPDRGAVGRGARRGGGGGGRGGRRARAAGWPSTSWRRGRTPWSGARPGAGKTELLRSLAAALASGERPDRLALVLVDGAGPERGEGLAACADLPHVRRIWWPRTRSGCGSSRRR